MVKKQQWKIYKCIIYRMINYLLYLLIGMLAGVSTGTIGVGAGVISMPLLTLSGMSIQQAVGTVLFMQLLPQSFPGFYLYHNSGHINYLNSIIVALGSLIGILYGAYLVNYNYVTEKQLYQSLAIILITVTIYYTKKCFFDNFE